MLNNNQIKLIHIAKRQIGMEEDEYRLLLKTFNADSCKDLSNSQFIEIMDWFARHGFKQTTTFHAPRLAPEYGCNRLLRKVASQLADLKLPMAYADGIAFRMFGIKKHEHCNPEQLRKIVSALNYKSGHMPTKTKGVTP